MSYMASLFKNFRTEDNLLYCLLQSLVFSITLVTSVFTKSDRQTDNQVEPKESRALKLIKLLFHKNVTHFFIQRNKCDCKKLNAW